MRAATIDLIDGAIAVDVSLVLPAIAEGVTPFAEEGRVAYPAGFVSVEWVVLNSRVEAPEGDGGEDEDQYGVKQELAMSARDAWHSTFSAM